MNKKIATIAALLTVTASAFSFAACGNDDTLKLEASDAKTYARVEEVLQATEKAPTGIGEISLSASADFSSAYFLCDASGEKIENQDNSSVLYSASLSANGLWNQSGDVDLKAHYSLTGEETSAGYAFAYLRGGYLMFNASETETIDLNTVELTAVDISEIVSQIISMPLPEVQLSGDISYDVIAQLALSYGTVSVGNGAIELDIDKTVASLVKDVLQTIDNVKAETTLGDIAQSNAVKKVFNALFGKCTAQEFRAALVSLLGSTSPDYASIFEALLPQPAETDETVHDCCVTLRNDRNVSKMILMYLNPTLTDAVLADVTFNDLFGENLESVIESVKNVIKMEYKGGALTLNLAIGDSDATISLKDVGLKLNVNSSNVITGVELNCGTLSSEVDAVVYDGIINSYSCNHTSVTLSGLITINMNSDKTIADISNVKTDLDATVGELLNPAE